jgi:hypothetical protein
MPYVQRVPNRLVRSEWATRIATELRVDEPVLREALRRAAADRRSEVKPKPELLVSIIKPAERQLIRMLAEASGFRARLGRELTEGALHRGLETERILDALISAADGEIDMAALAATLEPRDRRILFEVIFDSAPEPTWEAAESCLELLRGRKIASELADLERKILSQPPKNELIDLLRQKNALQVALAKKQGAA